MRSSCKRRHRYITVITDADTKGIIFMAEGKGSDSLRSFSDWLIAHNSNPSRIKLESCNFSRSFLADINAHLPRTDIVYDRFHLIKMANDASDKIRAKNQMNSSRNKWMRFKLLRNGRDLSDDEFENSDNATFLIEIVC